MMCAQREEEEQGDVKEALGERVATKDRLVQCLSSKRTLPQKPAAPEGEKTPSSPEPHLRKLNMALSHRPKLGSQSDTDDS